MKLINDNKNVFDCIGNYDLTVFAGTCDLSFGAGLIKEVNRKYDIKSHLSGSVIGFECVDKHKIGVLLIKESFKDRLIYSNLTTAIIGMRQYILANGVKTVAMPKIGTKHEKAEWEVILGIIESVFSDLDIEIIIVEKPSNIF